MTTRYSVIGGGIVGSSIAYHLSRRTDDPITVYERHTPGSETTTKSVAQFGYYGDQTQHVMKEYGMELYNKFFSNPKSNPRYTFSGLLEMSTSKDGAENLKRSVEDGGDPDVGKIAGTSVERDCVRYIPGEDLQKKLLIPSVNTDSVEGAIYRPRVGYLDRPHELAHEFLERAKDNGAEVMINTTVKDIQTKDGTVNEIVTSNGSTGVDEVVCAAGPWNIKIANSIGVDLPVEHTIAPAIQLEPTQPINHSLPVLGHYEGPYAIHRRNATELMVSYNPGASERTIFDPDSMGDSVPKDIRDGMIDAIEKFTPKYIDADLVDEWVGIRSQTPDGNPIVGWTDVEGFSIAALHTSGIQLAPAIGKMIATQLVDNEPGELYDQLSVSRFDGYQDFKSNR